MDMQHFCTTIKRQDDYTHPILKSLLSISAPLMRYMAYKYGSLTEQVGGVQAYLARRDNVSSSRASGQKPVGPRRQRYWEV